MKKLVVLFAFLASFNTQAFNQEKFNKDLEYYNLYKEAGKAIIILLSPFNTDNALKEASNLYNQGDSSKWMQLGERLNGAIQKGNDIGSFNYMSSCANASAQAAVMWQYATMMTTNNFGEWDIPEAMNLKMYKKAKLNFEYEFLDCKKVSNNPPKKKDYE